MTSGVRMVLIISLWRGANHCKCRKERCAQDVGDLSGCHRILRLFPTRTQQHYTYQRSDRYQRQPQPRQNSRTAQEPGRSKRRIEINGVGRDSAKNTNANGWPIRLKRLSNVPSEMRWVLLHFGRDDVRQTGKVKSKKAEPDKEDHLSSERKRRDERKNAGHLSLGRHQAQRLEAFRQMPEPARTAVLPGPRIVGMFIWHTCRRPENAGKHTVHRQSPSYHGARQE